MAKRLKPLGLVPRYTLYAVIAPLGVAGGNHARTTPVAPGCVGWETLKVWGADGRPLVGGGWVVGGVVVGGTVVGGTVVGDTVVGGAVVGGAVVGGAVVGGAVVGGELPVPAPIRNLLLAVFQCVAR